MNVSVLQFFPWLLFLGVAPCEDLSVEHMWRMLQGVSSVRPMRPLSVLATVSSGLRHICVPSKDPHGSSLQQLHLHNLSGQPWHSLRVVAVLVATEMGPCWLWWDVERVSQEQLWALYCWVHLVFKFFPRLDFFGGCPRARISEVYVGSSQFELLPLCCLDSDTFVSSP